MHPALILLKEAKDNVEFCSVPLSLSLFRYVYVKIILQSIGLKMAVAYTDALFGDQDDQLLRDVTKITVRQPN
jgi:hypothetical protein